MKTESVVNGNLRQRSETGLRHVNGRVRSLELENSPVVVNSVGDETEGGDVEADVPSRNHAPVLVLGAAYEELDTLIELSGRVKQHTSTLRLSCSAPKRPPDI